MLKLDLTFSLTLRPPSPGEPIPVFCALFRNMLAYASMYEYISYTIFFFFMWMVLEHCFHYGRLFHITTLYSYHVTLPAKFHLVKAIVFPVVMYRCESWTIKKANCQRINAFESWCWRRLFLRVPWTAGRSNQSILREINPEYSLEELMPKLKLQYFGHLMKSWLIGKDSDAGRDWGQEKGTTEGEMAGWHHWLDGRESEWTLGVGDRQGGLACCDSCGHKESDTTEGLNWTECFNLV